MFNYAFCVYLYLYVSCFYYAVNGESMLATEKKERFFSNEICESRIEKTFVTPREVSFWRQWNKYEMRLFIEYSEN